MEIWKPCFFTENYQVSNYGRVKGVKTNKILKSQDNGRGYLHVSLSINGKVNKHYVHRLVAQTFLENPEKKEEVNHIDGIRSNNNLENLEWVTRSENHFHRYKVLNQRGVNYGKKGKDNWRSKPVKQYDKEGWLVETYPGVMEAMRQTGIHEASIRGCIYGKQKSAGGYVWEYV